MKKICIGIEYNGYKFKSVFIDANYKIKGYIDGKRGSYDFDNSKELFYTMDEIINEIENKICEWDNWIITVEKIK